MATATRIQAPARYALTLYDATTGTRHFVADDEATAGLLHGRLVTAVCGDMFPASLIPQDDREVCSACPAIADASGLVAP